MINDSSITRYQFKHRAERLAEAHQDKIHLLKRLRKEFDLKPIVYDTYKNTKTEQ